MQENIQNKIIHLPWLNIFAAVALAATIAGALFATKTLSSINKNIAEAKENQRPANVKIVKITAPRCSDCFNIDDVVNAFKKQNVSVGEEKALSYDSSEAKSLIQSLGIKKVPTYVVTGEVKKKSLEDFVKSGGEIKNDTFVFTKVPPVFLDVDTGKKVGMVQATILVDYSCSRCPNPKAIVDQLKNLGVKIASQKEISWDSASGQQIINQYKITEVPTFLLSPDADFYDVVKNNWKQIGTVESDKTYVMRNVFPPYRDLQKNQITGLVDVIYLTDSTCKDCYKPEIVHKDILTKGLGVVLRGERTVDINSTEGKNLIAQYKITKVPTVILSPQVDAYTGLKNAWKTVGTVDVNGWYIFREIGQIGANITYKDLTTDQVIRPAQPPPGATGAGQ